MESIIYLMSFGVFSRRFTLRLKLSLRSKSKCTWLSKRITYDASRFSSIAAMVVASVSDPRAVNNNVAYSLSSMMIVGSDISIRSVSVGVR